MESVLEIEQLSFGYAQNLIFTNVDFAIRAGDFAGIIGANGTGKSTLLKLILGLLAPADGTIRLLGEDVRQFHHWPAVGYVPQGQTMTGQYFPATAFEVVQAGLSNQIGLLRFPGKKQREQVREALALVGVENLAGRLISQMSGGQQQRVMLARVLVTRPKLMLLDEPTTGIDARSVASLYELLKKLNQDTGLTILMVTHDLDRAAPFLNRVLCLDNGSLIELNQDQLADELGHRHKHPAGPVGVISKQ
ncbi:MAG: metal ABC transporter ATP-binding protein [Clostridiaceae bacterium]|nr:metal ABC transporter ATP-binding protein [Clostridiaceae bacterium]